MVIKFICACNTFLTSKVHSFRETELTVNIEWTSISSLVQVFEVVNWPYITKVTAYYNMAVSLYLKYKCVSFHHHDGTIWTNPKTMKL